MLVSRLNLNHLIVFRSSLACCALLLSCLSAPVCEAKPEQQVRRPLYRDKSIRALPVHVVPRRKHQVLPAIPFSLIESGDKCGIKLFRASAIQSKSDWESVWSRHNVKNSPPLPTIDFEKNTVLAVFAGQKLGTGYKLNIVSVERTADGGAHVVYKIAGGSVSPANQVTSGTTSQDRSVAKSQDPKEKAFASRVVTQKVINQKNKADRSPVVTSQPYVIVKTEKIKGSILFAPSFE